MRHLLNSNNDKTRTEYSVINTNVMLFSKIAAILLGYISRIVFTHTLSESYVGVNGLFSDILNVLALSELGIGTAVTYALYKPIAENDEEKQKSLMDLYKKMYQMVAAFVGIAGLALVPFLKYIIDENSDISHITIIYLLYLGNAVLSYLFIYKRTLIDAHQKIYISTLYQSGFLLIQNIIQIAILLITGNFIAYLATAIVCTVTCNVVISYITDRMYPYVKDKKIEPLDKAEKKSIYNNIKAMLMHRIGLVAVNNTDNLLLNYIAGIITVGCYSNYYLLIGSVRQMVDQVFLGITASVGNLGATEDSKHIKKIFESTFFIGQWMYGFATICLYELLSPFVEISFGKRFVFMPHIVFVLCCNFYVTGMRKATLVFRDALGLFWYDRYKSIAEAVINLIVSIILAQKFGAIGVFLGTFISTVTTSMWIEPFILYKYCFKCSVREYFIKYAVYLVSLAAAWSIVYYMCGLVHGNIIFTLVFRTAVCVVIINAVFLLCYCKTKEFGNIIKKIKGMRIKEV